MDASIGSLVRRALFVASAHPSSAIAFLRIALRQGKAARIRAGYREKGLSVPAFMIVSVTRRCNLNCAGCYSRASEAREREAGRSSELDAARLSRVITEAADLGVSFVLVAGGEPLVRAREVLEIAKANPGIIFPVFTNGTLIDDAMAASFSGQRNVIPVVSVEGGEASTDGRRGAGVYERARSAFCALSRAKVFFGASFTVTKGNAAELSSGDFVDGLMGLGARVFFYNEYTPIAGGTETLCIDADERKTLLSALEEHRRRYRAVFLAFPGDEDKFGGCLSSGRGFVHLAPDGSLEACPFAPFGDTSVRDGSLADALRSPLLSRIREHHAELAETSGGCALWNRREWADSLVSRDASS
jgi:MoaA/NifB/PqqE/SkfB family radical SAM enzyme